MRSFAFFGAVFAGLGVVFGAFGAHVLRQSLTPDNLQIFITGTNYQLIHGLALLILATLSDRLGQQRETLIGWLFIAGITIFSGSLYALSMTSIKSFGMVAPIGGLSLIAGWTVFAFSAWKLRTLNRQPEI